MFKMLDTAHSYKHLGQYKQILEGLENLVLFTTSVPLLLPTRNNLFTTFSSDQFPHNLGRLNNTPRNQQQSNMNDHRVAVEPSRDAESS